MNPRARVVLATLASLAALASLVPACGESESPAETTEAPESTTAPEPITAPEPTTAPEPAGDPLLIAEMNAYEAARPVFEEHCAACHAPKLGKKLSKKAKEALMHFSMGSYPFGGHHADELPTTIRKVLGATGHKPTMPKDDPGAVADAQLDAVLTWATAYDAAHAAKVGHHAEHGGDHDHGKMHGGHGRKPSADKHGHDREPKHDNGDGHDH